MRNKERRKNGGSRMREKNGMRSAASFEITQDRSIIKLIELSFSITRIVRERKNKRLFVFQ